MIGLFTRQVIPCAYWLLFDNRSQLKCLGRIGNRKELFVSVDPSMFI